MSFKYSMIADRLGVCKSGGLHIAGVPFLPGEISLSSCAWEMTFLICRQGIIVGMRVSVL